MEVAGPAMDKTQHTDRYARLLGTLRRARIEAGLTQGDVALRLGVYASYVSKCESGERRLDVIELAEFCRIYGTGLKAFLDAAGLD
jgi:transcriptional regulator with XRE-family HTH domain